MKLTPILSTFLITLWSLSLAFVASRPTLTKDVAVTTADAAKSDESLSNPAVASGWNLLDFLSTPARALKKEKRKRPPRTRTAIYYDNFHHLPTKEFCGTKYRLNTRLAWWNRRLYDTLGDLQCQSAEVKMIPSSATPKSWYAEVVVEPRVRGSSHLHIYPDQIFRVFPDLTDGEGQLKQLHWRVRNGLRTKNFETHHGEKALLLTDDSGFELSPPPADSSAEYIHKPLPKKLTETVTSLPDGASAPEVQIPAQTGTPITGAEYYDWPGTSAQGATYHMYPSTGTAPAETHATWFTLAAAKPGVKHFYIGTAPAEPKKTPPGSDWDSKGNGKSPMQAWA